MSSQLDRRRLLLACVTAAVLAAAIVPFARVSAGTLAQVDVYDRSAGEALPLLRHRGKQYIEGRTGNEYAVRIRNCSGARLLAVLSVDGVNAVNGETASYGQAGYVIEPGGYVTVEGWRKSLDSTAAFYFTDPQDSYASRTGRPQDLGVIGVALFRERAAPPSSYGSNEVLRAVPPQQKTAAADAAASSDNATRARGEMAPAAAPPSLGTGHGRNEYSPVREVEFERASARPDEVVAIRYETRDTLVAMGVLPTRRWPSRDPDPFPNALSFVPDP
jgi:hypothetical protein